MTYEEQKRAAGRICRLAQPQGTLRGTFGRELARINSLLESMGRRWDTFPGNTARWPEGSYALPLNMQLPDLYTQVLLEGLLLRTITG